MADYRQSVTVYVVPRLGGLPLQALAPEHLDRLYRDLERHGKRAGTCPTAGVTCTSHGCRKERHGGLSPKSVRNVHGMLHRALRDAVERGHLPRNVATLAHPPSAKQAKSKRGRDRAWTSEEVRAFLRQVEGSRLFPLWHLVATTGLRRAEALALRWSDVDLDRATLRVSQTVTVAESRIVWSDTTKTAAGERTLALDARTVDQLRHWRAAQVAERLTIGSLWNDVGLVFTTEDGSGLHPMTVSRTFARLAARAGLPAIGFHGLRHSYATAALQAGVPVRVVSQRLGHADVATTMNTYAHVLAGADEAAATAAADAILGA